MMTAALLTAAGAAAVGALPQLIAVNGGQPPAPLPAAAAYSQPIPAPTNVPPPVGIGPTSAGGSISAPGVVVGAAGVSQGKSKVISLAPNNVVAFRRDGVAYAGNLPLRSASRCEQEVTLEPVGPHDREGADLGLKLEAPAPPKLKVPPFATVNVPLRLSLKGGGAAGSARAGAGGGRRPLLPGGGWLRLLVEPAQNAEDACKTPDAAPAADPKKEPQREPPDPKKEPPDPDYQYLPFVIPETPPDAALPLRAIFFGSLGGAAAALVIAALLLASDRREPKVSLLGRMGGATWSFQQSWGSNVTIGAGILSTLVTAIAFPAHPHYMDRNSYTLLQVLFAALVTLAPLVYGLLRPGVQAGGAATAGAQGYVYMFLLAGALVLWAALGQLATLGVLVGEFSKAESLDAWLGLALITLAAGLALLLLAYGIRTLYQTPRLASQAAAAAPPPPPPPPPPASEGGATESAETKGVEAGGPAAADEGAPPEWPLL